MAAKGMTSRSRRPLKPEIDRDALVPHDQPLELAYCRMMSISPDIA
jgi:hypothetical protein